MTDIYPKLPFKILVDFHNGRKETWTGVNYNLSDRWLYIFHPDGTQYMFDTQGMKQITAQRIDND